MMYRIPMEGDFITKQLTSVKYKENWQLMNQQGIIECHCSEILVAASLRRKNEVYCLPVKKILSMMTCIYRVWGGKKGSQNVRLEIEPVEQMDLLTEYVHVEVDRSWHTKVVRSIRTKISAKAYYQVYLSRMSNDQGLDDIYRFLRWIAVGEVTECRERISDADL